MTRKKSRLHVVAFGLILLSGVGLPALGENARPSTINFNRDIRPIFSENCYACHGPDSNKRKAGLRLDRKEEAFKKLDSGVIPIVPGKLAESEIIRRITTDDDDDRMPPLKSGKKLSTQQISRLKEWVAQGAVWTPHWSYIPPERPPVPMVKNRSWPKNPIDFFVLAGLEKAGLSPSPESGKERLLRRVTLDLTGLPPTPEEVSDFLRDKSANAFEKVVDRLLASSAYGERMAEFWLDLARYADTNGYHIDNNRDMWLWREWVINAFNRNMPFDQFTVEQLAGDLLPNATVAQKIASGFNRNEMVNFEGGADPNEYAVKYVVGRVDCTSRVFLGTTLACCECHDHKFDPITQKEYYQFFAFFNTVEEKGLDGQTESPVPRMQVASPAQIARRDELDRRIAGLEKEQKNLAEEPRQSWDLSQRVWETFQTNLISQWTILEPVNFISPGGATLAKLPDNSILASETNAGRETYKIVLRTPVNDLTAVRLETLPDDSLPSKQAGRGAKGEFLLNGFEARIKRLQPANAEAVEPPVLGTWYSVGPFKGKDAREAFSKSFISEQEIDLNQKFNAGKLSWTNHPEWKEGVVQELKADNNTAIYLYRTLRVTKAEEIEVSLGSDDGLTVWLNGRKLLARDIARAPAADQEKVRLRLEAGENQFLLKINNVEGACGFYFRALNQAITEYPVEFTTAVADASAKDFPVSAVVEGKANSGWSVDDGTNARPHQAFFLPAQPFGFDGGSEIEIALKFDSTNQLRTLGRFRLSVSTADGFGDFARLPEAVRRDLFVEGTKRTATQRKDLQKYYRDNFVSEVKEANQKVAAEKQARTDFDKSIPVTMVMKEMEKPRETFLLVRGDFQNKGEKVTPDVPKIWPSLPAGVPKNRLALARWLVDPGHPLTARVAVNRYWQHYFGEGLVRTPADFGSQGEWPTHPELLDWLAREFIESGWDIKHMQKLIVLSAAYRQSSAFDPKKVERDPENRLLSRGPRVRLDAEAIRDQALAVSGLLNRKIGGPSATPYQPPGLWEAIGFTDNGNFSSQKYVQSSGADNYRRGLYTYWKRSMPYASFVAFDAPSREVCTVKRARTNTPLQALVLLNDPVYIECARALGQRLMSDVPGEIPDKIAYGFQLCLGRAATREEKQKLEKIFYQQLENFQADPAAARKLIAVGESKSPRDATLIELAAWTAVGNVLLNLDEMITKG